VPGPRRRVDYLPCRLTLEVMEPRRATATVGRVTVDDEPQTAGELIRFWRTRRRLSQLELALDANLSTKHLSFVETGRS
jgi:predicted transcriptional regulator